MGNPLLPVLPPNVESMFNNALIVAAFPAAVIACCFWLISAWLAHEPLTRWFEKEKLKKIEIHARRLQATRERLERKRYQGSFVNRGERFRRLM